MLFDWGETLMWIPGMIHDPDRHLACVQSIYEEHIRPSISGQRAQMTAIRFLEHYHEACLRQIAISKQTQREHSFRDRFAMSFELAGLQSAADPAAYNRMADALGLEVAQQARPLDDAQATVRTLSAKYRLGVVSNYPHGPVVEATLQRFDMRADFQVIVVSSQTGWMKPHAGCYAPALAALPAPASRTLMVGDDLTNDVKGAKALGLCTAWIAPGATAEDPDIDVHISTLAELPAHCERLFG